MTAVATSPGPGGMTVSFLHGWQGVLTLVVLAVAVGVAFLLVWAVSASGSERSEWQAWLDSRSRAGEDLSLPVSSSRSLEWPSSGEENVRSARGSQ